MIHFIKYIAYSIAEILFCVGLALLYVFLCVTYLGDLYGVLAVFASVGLWIVIASIFGGK